MDATTERQRTGHHTPAMEPRLMACLSGDAFEPRMITECARLAASLHTTWYALYLADTSVSRLSHHERHSANVLAQNVRLAAGLGATIVRVRPERVEVTLPAFARRQGITHVMMGEHRESQWAALWAASMLHAQGSRTAVLVIPGVDTRDAIQDGRLILESPRETADSDHAVTAATGARLVRWGLAVLALVLLFLLHAPAVVSFAGTVALAVFWCWELDADIRTPASEIR
jgi:K+-sensing histidine kinase KdpD